MEHAYDFHKLVGCANTLNHLAGIEYGENGLKFNRQHNSKKIFGPPYIHWSMERFMQIWEIIPKSW